MTDSRGIKREVGLRLAGLADGEGCFSIGKHKKGTYRCYFIIKLREDDRELLERLRDGCGGIGRMHRQERTNGWAPTVRWEVGSKADVAVLRDLFRRYPPWGKKRRDFKIWAQAVDFWLYSVGGDANGGTDWSPVAALKEQLHEVKRFVAPEANTQEMEP